MLKHLREFGQYVEITGLRNDKKVNVEELLNTIRKAKHLNVEVQFFDARFIAGWQHLYFAVLNALTAFRGKRNLSKSLAMETMLYASAQHQIRRAVEVLGVKPETKSVAVLIIGENEADIKSILSIVLEYFETHADDTVLELSKDKVKIIKRVFGISDLELETVMKRSDCENAVVNLIIERIALLATQR